MRQVDKGNAPTDKEGKEIIFKEYARSRRYLIDRIGEYCSYCERKIQANLAVEHVRPKSLNPELALIWNNFLLGCTNCNSTKGSKQIVLSNFVWPDTDPTFGYFKYDKSGIVKVADGVSNENLRAKINNTIRLVGLDKPAPRAGAADWERASDRRHEHRLKSFIDANRYSSFYKDASPEVKQAAKDLIRTIVIADGFWSIWITAFSDFPEMVNVLKTCIPGTKYP